MCHGQTQPHKFHHGPNLEEVTTFPPYSIFYAWPRALHPNVILSPDSQIATLEIFKMGIPATLEAHNFLCKPHIEVISKAKL